MGIIELILIALGLSMDAFAVSVSKGLAVPKIDWKKCLLVGIYFGIFQAGMPVIGYILGERFKHQIEQYDHWIAFILLAFIGGKMLIESLSKEKESQSHLEKNDLEKTDNNAFGVSKMLVLAIATSIDALATGVMFAFIKVEILLAAVLIGITTFVLSAAGVKIGNTAGVKYKSKAEMSGGIILILLGTKILLEHLEIIGF